MSSDRVEIRATKKQLAAWRVAAALDGLSLSEWMRRTLRDAALTDDEMTLLKKGRR